MLATTILILLFVQRTSSVTCEVCDVTDVNCSTSGKQNACDVTHPFCLTEVIDTLYGQRSVRRRCVDEFECQLKYGDTLNRQYCFEVERGFLNSDITCNFCCHGDLCNRGPFLVPPLQLLYQGEIIASKSAPTVTTSMAVQESTQKPSICDVCDARDSTCISGGTPTLCDEGEPYCMTTVYDNFPAPLSVERRCVSETVCERLWYEETSQRQYCYEVDQGELYFPVNCSFCCSGDLCNSGGLVPAPHTLYYPPHLLTTTGPVVSPPAQTRPTTIPLPICEVCRPGDPQCIMEGRPTQCDPDKLFCMTRVTEDNHFVQHVERSCVDLPTCERDWVNNTSGQFYCFDVDQGPAFFPNVCSFCCRGDLCNSGSLVPDPHTLYYPRASTTRPVTSQPTTTERPTTTLHHAICETCSSSDPSCMTGGQPTVCDLDTPFCLTSVTEDGNQHRTVERNCVNATVCEIEWIKQTSENFYCFDIDRGPAYFPNTCTFCCYGDMCNSGTLVPDAHTLFTPSTEAPTTNEPTSTPSSTKQTTTTTPPTTTIHHPICETCSSSDPSCMRGGQQTVCDIETPFCLTSVTEEGNQHRTTERRCVNSSVCEVEWIQKTSGNNYCFDVDRGPAYFPNTCTFCCYGDLCNSGTLVPDAHTLYTPSTEAPTTNEPTSTPSSTKQTTTTTPPTTTIHHPICETCSSSDPSCMRGGQQTVCDIETPFCLTSVTEEGNQHRTVKRRCVNSSFCEVEWIQKTSGNNYCFDVDRGPAYFPNTCTFCCYGDLCNSGTLVPDAHTLYTPSTEAPTTNEPTSTPSSTKQTTTTTPPTTTIHHPICETCSSSDPSCMRGGQQTVCDIETPFCLTSVTEEGNQHRTVERRCVNSSVCEVEWIQKTSGNNYCFDVDRGPAYFPNTCTFCCYGDLCNSGTLVPDAHTLYTPSTETPTTNEPTSTKSSTTQTTTTTPPTTTIHHPICETCSSSDPKCMTGGQQTVCDLETPFCLTSVTEEGNQHRTTERRCVNSSVCEVEWIQKTSGNNYCFDVDRGPAYFPNTCTFCCNGDLCNSGTLVPDVHTLYRPSSSAPSSKEATTTTNTTPTTTVHHPVCETCSSSDRSCMTGGQQTVCDLDAPYCLTSVTEDGNQIRVAERKCVNGSVCKVEWIQKTSGNNYCFDVDRGPAYFPNTCTFCCYGDLCNSGTLVPDAHTLYSITAWRNSNQQCCVLRSEPTIKCGRVVKSDKSLTMLVRFSKVDLSLMVRETNFHIGTKNYLTLEA